MLLLFYTVYNYKHYQWYQIEVAKVKEEKWSPYVPTVCISLIPVIYKFQDGFIHDMLSRKDFFISLSRTFDMPEISREVNRSFPCIKYADQILNVISLTHVIL